MTAPLIFDERDAVGGEFELDDQVAAACAKTGLVTVSPLGGRRWRVTPTGKVGAAWVGNLDIVVSPKDSVPISRLLFLIGFAKNPGFLNDTWATASHESSLLEILAESLARHVERALRLGPLQGYVTVNDSLTTVRGRIDLAQQIRSRPGLSYPIAVTFDDYTHDIAENQILRTAIQRMLAMPKITVETRRRLRHSIGKLSGSSTLRRGVEVPQWRATRLNERYHNALRFAEMILRDCSFEADAGGKLSIAAFAVNMEVVFEDFLVAAVTAAATKRAGAIRGQHRSHLDVDRTVRIRPDIVQIDHDQVLTIIDAKYKSSVDVGSRNPDAYQMLAYCTALGVPEAWLVHASPGAAAGEKLPIRVRGTDVTIRQWGLDLSCEPHAILAQVEDLVETSMLDLQHTSVA